jgi:hypothetical protein
VEALAPVDKSREYLAVLSCWRLRKYSQVLRFVPCTFQIQRPLRGCPGAIGNSLRAKPLSRKFWTPSVWENERALTHFAAKVPLAE